MVFRTAAVFAAAFTLLSAPVALASAATAPHDQPTWDELFAQQTLNRQHTADVLPRLDPNARDIDLSDFGDNRVSKAGAHVSLGGQVWFTDAAGRENIFIGVSNPNSLDGLRQGCAKATRCSQVREHDGSQTFILEMDEQTPVGTATTRWVENLRPDGTNVLIDERNYLPDGDSGEPAGAIHKTFPLTVNQALALARDKAYQI